MILGISGLLLAIAGIIASIFALMSKELNKNRPLKYSIISVLAFLALFAAAMSFYGFVQANNSPAPTAASNVTPTLFYIPSNPDTPSPPAPSPILPTQTNIPTQIPISETPTTSPTNSLTVSATNTIQLPTAIFTSSPAQASIPECRFDNLINCSTPISIFVNGDSISTFNFIDGNVAVDFNNVQNGSGISFQFSNPLDVRDFTFVELIGTSTNTFGFEIEYKVKAGNEVVTVITSQQGEFRAVSEPQTIQMPIFYDGEIDELAINFYEKGQSATFTIASIRLMPQN